MFRQILVGLDGSSKSMLAAQVAFDLGKYYSGHVTLIHVPHAESWAAVIDNATDFHSGISRPSFDAVEAAGQKILDDALALSKDAGFDRITTHMPHGNAALEIVNHANRIGADLIVTGRRGLGDVASVVLGSTTRRINHLAKCACLSVM